MVPHSDRLEEGNRQQFVSSLIDLAFNGLSKMFDSQSHLFRFKAIKDGASLRHEGSFLRYTLISLLGLYRYEKRYGKNFLDVGAEVEFHGNHIASFTSGGDIGYLLWLTALCRPEKIESMVDKCRWETLKTNFPDLRQNRTMELSWLLTGYSYCALGDPKSRQKAADDAHLVYALLKSNYGGKGIFRHQAARSPWSWLNSLMGSFADQVYPIYALTKYSQAFDKKEVLTIALECADTICKLQGPLGQWWWHYDPSRGTVAGRYPVYSVHQEGMAPFPLFALSQATERDYSHYIYKGLEWIRGNNELQYTMIDFERNVVWRNIHLKTMYRRIEEMFNLIGISNLKMKNSNLVALHECWSYELGWLLYAFADGKI